MPTDTADVQAGHLTDVQSEQPRMVPANKTQYYGDEKGVTPEQETYFSDRNALDTTIPTDDELHGPGALRRIAAPIPWAVFTVAFVELCERFSYYGTQVVCMLPSNIFTFFKPRAI